MIQVDPNGFCFICNGPFEDIESHRNIHSVEEGAIETGLPTRNYLDWVAGGYRPKEKNLIEKVIEAAEDSLMRIVLVTAFGEGKKTANPTIDGLKFIANLKKLL